MDYAEVVNRCDAKAERVGLAQLSPIERSIVLVSRVDFEVVSGGLSGFFYNSAGDHAAEMVAALEEVGAPRAAAALKEAMSRFPGGAPSTDRVLRYAEWQNVSESLQELDEEFGEDDPDVFSRMCTYIKDHAGELREHGADA